MRLPRSGTRRSPALWLDQESRIVSPSTLEPAYERQGQWRHQAACGHFLVGNGRELEVGRWRRGLRSCLPARPLRPDVLVEAEHVVRVVAAFEVNEPCVPLGAIRRFD
jgi:hypothetical protein